MFITLKMKQIQQNIRVLAFDIAQYCDAKIKDPDVYNFKNESKTAKQPGPCV